MKRPDAPRLIDIVDHANSLKRIIKTNSIEEFINDDTIQAAVLYHLIVIGEAVANITDDLKDKYTAIPWSDIKAFRNYVIHEYFNTDFERVWNAAILEVPILREKAIEIYQIEFPSLLQYLPAVDSD